MLQESSVFRACKAVMASVMDSARPQGDVCPFCPVLENCLIWVGVSVMQNPEAQLIDAGNLQSIMGLDAYFLLITWIA